MTDNSCAKGVAFCMANGSTSGQGAVDGDYYDDGGKTVSKGTAYGWVSSQSYVDALEYTDKLMYAYEFDKDSSYSFSDRYTSTYGSSYGVPLWESSRTGANGVLTLNGKNQYADLDRSILYTDDIDIQLGFLSRGQKGECLLYLGNDSAYIKIVASNENGVPEVILCDGERTQKLVSDIVPALGKFTKLRLVLDGDTGRLDVEGINAAAGEITIDPSDIARAVSASDGTAAYRLGGDNNAENLFNGSVDFLRIYSSEGAAPTESYTETEKIEEEKGEAIVGDLNFDGIINVFDLIELKRVIMNPYDVLPPPIVEAAGDLSGSDGIGPEDAKLMAQYLTGEIKEFPAGAVAEYVKQ